MTSNLKKAFEAASKLPPADQDALAAAILEEVKVEGLWDASFAKTPGALERLTQPCRSTGRARRAPSILTSSDLPHDEAVSRGVRLPAVSSRPVSSQPPVQAGPPDAAHLLGAHVPIDPHRRAPPRSRLRSSSESGDGLRAPEGIRSDSATAVARIAQRDGRILFVIHYR